MISAGAGWDNSLKAVQKAHLDRHATKDNFEEAVRAHKKANDEMRSEQREATAAFVASRQGEIRGKYRRYA